MSRTNSTILMCLIIQNVTEAQALTCDEILELPENDKISFGELRTMSSKEIVRCLSHLGRERLPMNEAQYIWQSVIDYHDGLLNIPENVLCHLHWVTVAVQPEDYENMTLGNIDVITNFGLNYNLNEDQLGAIANRVREDFASKGPEHYSYYDLTALRQILCAFNRSEIERIQPSAYKEAALFIGKLEKCSADAMRGFAKLAVHKSAFGPQEHWTNMTMETLGWVIDYLPKNIPKKRTIDETNTLKN